MFVTCSKLWCRYYDSGYFIFTLHLLGIVGSAKTLKLQLHWRHLLKSTENGPLTLDTSDTNQQRNGDSIHHSVSPGNNWINKAAVKQLHAALCTLWCCSWLGFSLAVIQNIFFYLPRPLPCLIVTVIWIAAVASFSHMNEQKKKHCDALCSNVSGCWTHSYKIPRVFNC